MIFLQKQLKGYERVKENLNAYVEEKGQTDKIHPEYVMSVVDQLASKDAIFTVDTGMTCVWGARYLHGTGERKMLGSFQWQMLFRKRSGPRWPFRSGKFGLCVGMGESPCYWGIFRQSCSINYP